MTPVEAQKIVALLLASFPTQVKSMSAAEGEAMARMYTKSLVDLESTRAMAAVERLVKTARFLPTIAEIRSSAIDVVHGRRRAGGDAWGDVLRKIGRYGYTRTPGVDFEFEDPLVGEAVRSLSWRALCDSENSYSDRARFIELYDQLAAGERVEAAASEGARSAVLPDRPHASLPSGANEPQSLGGYLDRLLPRGKGLPS